MSEIRTHAATEEYRTHFDDVFSPRQARGGHRDGSGRKKTLFGKVTKSFVLCQWHVREISRQRAERKCKSTSEALRAIIEDVAERGSP